jgi:arginyl-tRNA--protein-N-Asp/Glu arginylyltransferase
MQEHCEVLIQIKSDIPQFAAWKTNELYSVFDRYIRIMHMITNMKEYKHAAFIAMHTHDIERYILVAMRAKNTDEKKVAFNKAVNDMILYIDYLLALLTDGEDGHRQPEAL